MTVFFFFFFENQDVMTCALSVGLHALVNSQMMFLLVCGHWRSGVFGWLTITICAGHLC